MKGHITYVFALLIIAAFGLNSCKKTAALEDQVNQLKNQIAQLQETLKTVQSNAGQQSSTTVKVDLSAMEQQFAALREEIEKLKSSQSTTVDLSNIEQQLAKFSKELEQLQSSQSTDLSSIEQQLAEFSTALEQLKSSQSTTVDLSSIEQQLAEFSTALEQLQSSQSPTVDISSIEQQLAEFSTALEQLKSSQSTTVDLSSIEQQLAEFSTALEQLQSSQSTIVDLSNIEQQLAKFSEDLEQLKGSQSSIPQSTLDNIIARLNDLQKQSQKINPPISDYVDLGLPSGTFWATCNIGAENPEDYGNYYAWGETEGCDKDGNPTDPNNPKTIFTWSTYLDRYYSSRVDYTHIKYNKTDMKLEYIDDVAYVKWGGTWRIPTYTQFSELQRECYWQWTTTYKYKSVSGYIVYKAKEESHKGRMNLGNSYSYDVSKDTHIFLPAAGRRNDIFFEAQGLRGYYWLRELQTYDNGIVDFASSIYFESNRVDDGSYGMSKTYFNRYLGHSVRPVCSRPTE